MLSNAKSCPPTHTHIHTHIYIYIYILHGSVCDPGFHGFSDRRTGLLVKLANHYTTRGALNKSYSNQNKPFATIKLESKRNSDCITTLHPSAPTRSFSRPLPSIHLFPPTDNGKIFLKSRLIWLIFVRKVGVICVYVCLSLCGIEC